MSSREISEWGALDMLDADEQQQRARVAAQSVTPRRRKPMTPAQIERALDRLFPVTSERAHV